MPSAGSLPLVIIRPFSGPSRESSVRGVGPGLVPGDVVGADGVVPLDLGAAHLRGVVVAALVQDLHQRECRLVVDGLVQAGLRNKCRNTLVSAIREVFDSSPTSILLKFVTRKERIITDKV